MSAEPLHADTGRRCLVGHSDHGACIKCACGQFVAPGEWDTHVTPAPPEWHPTRSREIL